MMGMTRSRLWRFRSTIQSTFGSARVCGSMIASQTLPSSSSASPRMEMNRPPVPLPKWVCTYRFASAPKSGAAAPRPDRARRVVDRERILRAARVRLEAAVFTKLGQVGTVEPAEQVLDRVQHGRCVRLHRDPVLRLQVEEVEGRHQRDHRGRRGLMAADLEVVTLRPLAVRVVDDPGREPEHPALDRGHRLEIGGRN